MAIVLLVLEDNKETAYTLGQTPTLAGRGSHCHIKLSNELCSGEHCQFILNKDNQAFVMDLGSTNGISLNGSKTQNSKLFLGDELLMGEAKAWLDGSKMNGVETVIHTRAGSNKLRPPKPVLKLPRISSGKTDKMLASSLPKGDRTSTAVRNVRKARAKMKKNKD